MVIPDIQTQNLNGATFQPNVSTVDVIKSPNAVAAVNTDSKSGSSTTGSGSSDTHSASNGTKVTLSSDRERASKSDANENAQQQNQRSQEQVAKSEFSLTMTGIPLYGGALVSVIKYPDGQSEMFDAITGKRITQEDVALLNVLHGAAPDQMLQFESTESYSGLTASEVYQRIQELLNKDKDTGTEVS